MIETVNVGDWQQTIMGSLAQPSFKFRSSANHSGDKGLSIPVDFCCMFLIFHF